jgi:hypothetical protein
MKTIDQWVGAGGFVHRLREHEDGDLDVQYLDGSWQNIGDRAALYRLREVLAERSSGAALEGARIREGLHAAVRSFESQGARLIQVETLRAAIDRVIPEQG